MWSSTNQRIKALMGARQREKDRLTRPIHVRRADLHLKFKSDDGVVIEVPARALLNEFTVAGFCAYAQTGLTPNVDLTIDIQHPKAFHLTAKVVWCQYQDSSAHVLTSEAYPYRVGLALMWKDPAAEAVFKKFCAELAELYVSKKALFIEEGSASGETVAEAAAGATAQTEQVATTPPTAETVESPAATPAEASADTETKQAA